MRNKFLISAMAAMAVLSQSSSASAANFLFDFTGTFNAQFKIDTAVSPDVVRNDAIFSVFSAGYNNIPVVFNGADRMANVSFGRGNAATFNLNLLAPGPQPFTQLIGPDLFSGSPMAPVFTPGIFALRNPFFGQNLMLTISEQKPIVSPGAIPEPGAWALLIAGFGLLGSAIRRQRRSLGLLKLA